MKHQSQRLIAIGLIATGSVTGLWLGVSFFRAHGQGGDVPTGQAPAQLPPPDQMPAPGNTPPPAGNLPPAESAGGPQDIPSEVRTSTDGFVYNPEGLRDPFFPARGMIAEPVKPKPEPEKPLDAGPDLTDPLQMFELREYRLVAVLWDVRQPKAMVATPDGKVWTIRQKVRLGRAGAIVAAIRESEIVIVEPNPDGSYINASTRILSIKK